MPLVPVRVLHARHGGDHGRPARARPRPRRGRGARRAVGEPVPLHRVPEHRRRRPAGGRAACGPTGRPAPPDRTARAERWSPASPAPASGGSRTRASSPVGVATSTTCGSRGCSTPPSCGRRCAHALVAGVDVSEARALPGVVAVLTADDLDGRAGRLRPAGPARPGGSPSFPALARDRVRLVGDPVAVVVAESRALAEDAADAVGRRLRPARAGRRRRGGHGRQGAPLVFPELGTNVVHRSAHRYGDTDRAFAAADRVVRGPAPPAPPRQRPHGVPGARGRPRPRHRRPRRGRLAPVPARPAPPAGRGARAPRQRGPGALRRHRRRVRPEERPVPRGRGGGRRRRRGRAAGEVDRGPQREPHRRAGRPARSTSTSTWRSTTTARCSACGSGMVLDQGAYPQLGFPATGYLNIVRALFPAARTASSTTTSRRRSSPPTRRPTSPTGAPGRSRPGPASGCSTWSPTGWASTRVEVRRRNLLVRRRAAARELHRRGAAQHHLPALPRGGGRPHRPRRLPGRAGRGPGGGAAARDRVRRRGGAGAGPAEPHPGHGVHVGAPHRAGGPGPPRARRHGHGLHQPAAPRPGPRDHPCPARRRPARRAPRPGAGRARRHADHAVQPGRHRRQPGRDPGQRRGGGRGQGRPGAGAGRRRRAARDRPGRPRDVVDGEVVAAGRPGGEGLAGRRRPGRVPAARAGRPERTPRHRGGRPPSTRPRAPGPRPPTPVTVEVDPVTGLVSILRFVVVEDCGHVINPAIVDGQVRGGVVQGIGAVLFERSAYDGDGQYLASTFLDYLVPTASDVPSIEVHHVEPTAMSDIDFRGVGRGRRHRRPRRADQRHRRRAGTAGRRGARAAPAAEPRRRPDRRGGRRGPSRRSPPVRRRPARRGRPASGCSGRGGASS